MNVHATEEDLDRLAEMAVAGTLRPVIDRRYPFAEIPAALSYLETLRARGKVVVEIG